MTTGTATRLERREIKPEIGADILTGRPALVDGSHASELRAAPDQPGIVLFPAVHSPDEKQAAFSKITT
jgi:alpha-ketoglutarate-dependent taurine dioxygenase